MNYSSDASSSYGTPSPSSTYRRFSEDQTSSPTLPQYSLSSDFAHLVEEPGMNVVIARKVAKLQDSLPNLSADKLRQAKADMIYLLTVLNGESGEVAQIKAGEVFISPV